MARATESELELLHAAVAKVLREQIGGQTITILGDDGEEKEVNLASPQIIAQAIKFLKDNSITATPEVGDDLNDLADMLKNKPQRGRTQLRAVDAKKAAAEE